VVHFYDAVSFVQRVGSVSGEPELGRDFAAGLAYGAFVVDDQEI
jgi:hypothetical protein